MPISTEQYVPDFEVRIDGQVIRHSVTTGAMVAANQPTIEVMSVSLTESINQADSFLVKLRGERPPSGKFGGGAVLSWLDDKLFDEGARVEIQLGYVDDRSREFMGYITAMSAIFPEQGAPVLVLRGFSRYHMLQRRQRRKPFSATTDSDMAREIAGELGFETDIDEVDTTYPTASPENATYAAILQSRAERINFEVAVRKDVLIFKRPAYFADSQPTFTLTWGVDLLSFSPNLTTYDLPTEVTVRNTQTWQGGQKQAIAAAARADQVPCVLAQKSGPQIAREKFGDHVVLSVDQRVSSLAEANMLARAQMERKALDYIVAHGLCIGNPRLAARMVIELQGLGNRFSGKYYVTSTTHTIDANRYLTEFVGKRDGR